MAQGEATLELPDFPSIGGSLKFTLPPIPRLLPTWEHLQSIAPVDMEDGQFARGGRNTAGGYLSAAAYQTAQEDAMDTAAHVSAPPVAEYAATVGAGAGIGVLLGVVFALGARRMRNRAPRVQLRRPPQFGVAEFTS